MNDDATVFSRIHRVVFNINITITELEQLLQEFVTSIGRALACNEVIMGHIKVLAKFNKPKEHFLFFSATRLDRVDITPSEFCPKEDNDRLSQIELHVNVLIFGYTMSEVERVVNEAFKGLDGCVCKAQSSRCSTRTGKRKTKSLEDKADEFR